MGPSRPNKRYRIYEREYLGNFMNFTLLSPDGWSGKNPNKNQKCFHDLQSTPLAS